MHEEVHDKHDVHARAIQADVMQYVVEGNVGWSLDEFGRGIGRHFAEKFHDPTLVKPYLPGRYCRKTLVEDDNKKWQVVELCERLDALVDLSAEFHGLAGDRYVLTVITDAEKAPQVMGFRSPLEFRGLGWGSQSVEAPNPTPLQNG